MKTEFEIHGRRIVYDGCSTTSLEDSKSFYYSHANPSWIYVGSGYKIWLDGIEYKNGKLYHFFIKPNRKDDINFCLYLKQDRAKKLKKLFE